MLLAYHQCGCESIALELRVRRSIAATVADYVRLLASSGGLPQPLTYGSVDDNARAQRHLVVGSWYLVCILRHSLFVALTSFQNSDLNLVVRYALPRQQGLAALRLACHASRGQKHVPTPSTSRSPECLQQPSLLFFIVDLQPHVPSRHTRQCQQQQ